MKIKAYIVVLFSLLSLIAICPSVMAHSLWINPGDSYPQVGSTVDIGIGWGHKYPANRVDQEIKEDLVESVSAVDPDGLAVNLTKVPAVLYKLPVKKAGAYLITAKIKSGFFTTTPDGRKRGDKKTVANPIKCTNFHIEAKTVIIAGGNDKNLRHAVGQSLELVPLTSLQNLKKGDKLSFKVLFEGKPLPDAAVKATYAGFEAQDIAPHAQAQKDGQAGAKRFPVETVTDKSGQATLQLDQAGYWMIMLSHKPPFPDPQICDECMYNVAFTFEIRARQR